MIVIAIIGILASVAVPQYGTYVKRSRFTEIVNAASEAQSSIATCLQVHYGLDACDTWGELQLDKARFELRELIQSAELQSNPFVFTLTAIPALNSATYTISVTANESGDTVSWDFGGTCKSSWNYC